MIRHSCIFSHFRSNIITIDVKFAERSIHDFKKLSKGARLDSVEKLLHDRLKNISKKGEIG